ncbi:MAG: hypothetical protein KDD35_01165 [Bdellovibrionales bacterium]|nr:hypothetical protein [Bdellovibrionales bacterium]
MRHLSIIFAFVCNSLLSFPSRADWVGQYLQQKKCFREILDHTSERRKALPKDIQVGLIKVFRKYVREQSQMIRGSQNRRAASGWNPIRKDFQFGDDTYIVIDILGSRSEGIVYVAEGAGGLAIIKDFFRESMGPFHINAQFKKGDRYGDLKIINKFENSLMFNIIVGPTTNILGNIGKLESFGLSGEEALRIYQYFQERDIGSGDFNQIVDIDSGDIFLIDPY